MLRSVLLLVCDTIRLEDPPYSLYVLTVLRRVLCLASPARGVYLDLREKELRRLSIVIAIILLIIFISESFLRV